MQKIVLIHKTVKANQLLNFNYYYCIMCRLRVKKENNFLYKTHSRERNLVYDV